MENEKSDQGLEDILRSVSKFIEEKKIRSSSVMIILGSLIGSAAMQTEISSKDFRRLMDKLSDDYEIVLKEINGKEDF